MSPEKIGELLFKHLKSELTDAEEKELKSWIDSSRGNRKLFKELNDQGRLAKFLRQLDRSKQKTRS